MLFMVVMSECMFCCVIACNCSYIVYLHHPIASMIQIIFTSSPRHCTYCVVPSVRGVEQSRSMEAILQECLSLASSGYKEVTLLGQNIDAYGRDMMPKRTFADLLHYLNNNLPDGTIERIRYVTRYIQLCFAAFLFSLSFCQHPFYVAAIRDTSQIESLTL